MSVIPKPSKTIYKAALDYAESLRESDNDPQAIGHTLLYLAERNRKLESVAQAAEAYVRFGEDTQLHTDLLKALEKFDNYEVEAETMEDPKFGLS